MTFGNCARGSRSRLYDRAMEKARITRLLEDQILRLWGKGDLSVVDRNYAATIVDHMPIPGQQTGRAAMRKVVTDFRTALPDMVLNLHGTIACGALGVDFWTLEGTHSGPLFGTPPSGRRVRFSGIDMVQVADNRIAEIWHVEEMLQFAGQIGGGEASFGAPVGTAPMPIAAGTHDPGASARHPDLRLLSDMERRHLAIARDHIEQIWARGDASAAYRLYAPEVIDHMPAPGQRPGIPGIIDVLGWLREAVPDLTMTIEDYVVEGNLAADRWVMRGTHTGAPLMGVTARGKAFEINGMDVIRIRDDFMISDVWHVEDFASLRAQISA